MKQFSFTFLFLVVFSLLFSQQSKDISLLANWDQDTLPKSGGIHYNDVWGYVDCFGAEYALLGSAGYVHFFNLTDLSNIQEVEAFPGGEVTTWRDIKTYKNRAYSVCDGCNEGMMIFDLSNLPDSVSKVLQTSEFFSKSHNIFIDEANGKLYAVGTDTQGDGVIILDLTQNPDAPTLWARHDVPGGYMHDIYVRDNIGYGFSGHDGLWIYDFSDPDTALVLGSLDGYPQEGYNHSGWLSEDGDYLVFADESFNRSLKLTDVSEFSDIQVTDLFRSKLLAPADTGSIAHNPMIRDNYIISSYYHDGVSIFDYSDPYNVEQIAWYDTWLDNTNYNGFIGCWGIYPFLPSGRILASDIRNGLYVLGLDSIVFNPIVPTLAPDAIITLSSDPDLCEGDSLTFNVAAAAQKYQWFKGDTLVQDGGLSFTTYEDGTYYLKATNDYCAANSEQVKAVFNNYPNTALEILGETEFCEGDSVQILILENAETIDWFQSDDLIATDTNSIHIFGSGFYHVALANGTCISLSENVEIESIPYPSPNLNLSGINELCAGDTLSLITQTQAESYAWYLDSLLIQNFGAELEITVGGNYSITFANQFCESNSEIVEIQEISIPDAILSSNSNPWFCEDDPPGIIISLPPGADQYQWYESDSLIAEGTNTLIVTAGGNYYAIAINGNDCFEQSDNLVISQFSYPQIEIIPSSDIYCEGEAAFLTATSDYNLYQWYYNGNLITDIIGNELVTVDSGVYEVEVSNGFCTSLSEELEIEFQKPVIPEIQFDGALVMATEASEYQWFLNGNELLGETAQSVDALLYGNGDYLVETIDENGCEAVSEVLFVLVSGNHEMFNHDELKVFPNPFTSSINVQFDFKNPTDISIELFSQIGQTVKTYNYIGIQYEIKQIEVSILAPGNYILKIAGHEKVFFKRVVKH